MHRQRLHASVTCLVFGTGTLLAATAGAQTVSAPSSDTPAQQKPAKSLGRQKAAPAAGADDAAKDPARGQRAYDAGVAAYQAGRHDEAINQLNAAVKAGGLAGPAMAKALYYRGAAFHAKNMPGQAISDLTSALWFKGGLDTNERAEATRIRGEAYAAAGLDPSGNARSAAAAAAATSAASGPVATTGGNWIAASTPSAAPPQLSAVPTETPQSTSGGGVDLGNVFGGLFGGLSGGAKPVETSAVPREAQPTPVQTNIQNSVPSAVSSTSATAVTAGSAGSEVLPWGGVAEPGATPTLPAASDGKPQTKAKTVRQAAATPANDVPPSAATANPAPAKSAAGGAYRIQVGTAKSQAEADALAAKAKQNPGLGAAAVTVDTMAFGGSTFYRVRVGPYATAADTRSPCAAMKSGGLDCLVVTQ